MKRTLKQLDKASCPSSSSNQITQYNNTVINDLIDKNYSAMQTRQIELETIQDNQIDNVGAQSIQQIMNQLQSLENVKYSSEKKNKEEEEDVSQGKSQEDQEDEQQNKLTAYGQKVPETEQQRKKRLFQNKKSAQKCRLKKALEFETMRIQFQEIQKQNEQLKEKLTQTNMLLLSKIQENNQLQSKLEQNQMNSTMLLTNILVKQKTDSTQSVQSAPEVADLMSLYQQLQDQGINKQISPNMNLFNSGISQQLTNISNNQNQSPMTAYNDPLKAQSHNIEKLQQLIGQINSTQKSNSALQARNLSQMTLPTTTFDVKRRAKLQKIQNHSETNSGDVPASNLTKTLQAQLANLQKLNQPNRTPQVHSFGNLGNFADK